MDLYLYFILMVVFLTTIIAYITALKITPIPTPKS